jgi:hypothetical protein
VIAFTAWLVIAFLGGLIVGLAIMGLERQE